MNPLTYAATSSSGSSVSTSNGQTHVSSSSSGSGGGETKSSSSEATGSSVSSSSSASASNEGVTTQSESSQGNTANTGNTGNTANTGNTGNTVSAEGDNILASGGKDAAAITDSGTISSKMEFVQIPSGEIDIASATAETESGNAVVTIARTTEDKIPPELKPDTATKTNKQNLIESLLEKVLKSLHIVK